MRIIHEIFPKLRGRKLGMRIIPECMLNTTNQDISADHC